MDALNLRLLEYSIIPLSSIRHAPKMKKNSESVDFYTCFAEWWLLIYLFAVYTAQGFD